ncbi:MFS transporter [Penicillium argentinense]|uniref:MFS transporter n=1 Tax=Penicillium argentinense TaxID=1131581 RepID=A0A9W9FDJ2_9EURO|nr:MFS transporter [Penicillium argentinense]KAJ5098241.1 MFS transporter [Penicillium argentinense]
MVKQRHSLTDLARHVHARCDVDTPHNSLSLESDHGGPNGFREYIILFTFPEGYRFIFGETYGLSQGLTSITWAGIFVGMGLTCLIVSTVYTRTRAEHKRTNRIGPPRIQSVVCDAGLGGRVGWLQLSQWACSGWAGPAIIWSPLITSAFVGFGMTTIFTSDYLDVIDSYGMYSASALGFVAFTQYLLSGGVMISGSTIYERHGVHYTLTVVGAICAAMAFIPYMFYFYGARIRQFSKHAANKV